MKYKKLLIVISGVIALSVIYVSMLNEVVKEFQQTKIYKAGNIILDRVIEENK